MRKTGRLAGLAAVGLAAAGMIAMGAAPAAADMFASKNRAGLFSSQKSILDNRASKQYSASVRLQPPKVVTPTKWDAPKYNGSYKGAFLTHARAAATRARTSAAPSAGGGSDRSAADSAGTSTCKSIRSNRGPEIRV